MYTHSMCTYVSFTLWFTSVKSPPGTAQPDTAVACTPQCWGPLPWPLPRLYMAPWHQMFTVLGSDTINYYWGELCEISPPGLVFVAMVTWVCGCSTCVLLLIDKFVCLFFLCCACDKWCVLYVNSIAHYTQRAESLPLRHFVKLLGVRWSHVCIQACCDSNNCSEFHKNVTHWWHLYDAEVSLFSFSFFHMGW